MQPSIRKVEEASPSENCPASRNKRQWQDSEKAADGRTIVITGASRGLGLAIAAEILSEGYRALIIARHRSEGIDVLGGKYGARCKFVEFDLANIADIPELVKTYIRPEPNLYGLINNAAIGREGVLATMHNSEIERTFLVNSISPILLTKYVIRFMLERGEGRIINISSIIANTGYSGLSVYAASKAALEGHSKSLAREVGRAGITVNCIAPGFMKTDMTSELSDEKLAKIINRSSLKSLAEVSEVAKVATFLLSSSSRSITGTSITVDAGSTA